MLYAASQCSGPTATGPLAETGIETEIVQRFGDHNRIGPRAPLYLVVEKILESGEKLPQQWPVDGTVGYEFGNSLNNLFVQRQNERAFTNLYHRFIDGTVDVGGLIYNSKKLIMETALSSEVTVLTDMLQQIASGDRRARDFTRNVLMGAIREVIACFPVYRTYIDARGRDQRARPTVHTRGNGQGEGTQSNQPDSNLRLPAIGAAAGYQRRSDSFRSIS